MPPAGEEPPIVDGIPLESPAALTTDTPGAAAQTLLPPAMKRKRRRGGLPPLLFVLIILLAVGSAVIAALMLWPRGEESIISGRPATPPPLIPEPRPEIPDPEPPVEPDPPQNPENAQNPATTPGPTPPANDGTDGTNNGEGAGDPTPPGPVVDPEIPEPAPPVPEKLGAEGAREILDAFLAANSVEERLRYVQTPGKVKAKMKAYYEKHPLEVASENVEFKLSSTVPDSDREFHIFQITTGGQEAGFPVSVEETNTGLRVDWVSFVQFHDNSLGKFIKIYQHQPESFHCIVERAHYFRTDVPDLGSKICLRIQPPIPGYEGYAFIDRASPLAEVANGKFEWDHMYFPILKLKWIRTKEGQQFIEVVEIVQDNWRATQ